MLVRMINRDAAVNRRRVLLAVGGLSLISAVVPGLARSRPDGPRPVHRGGTDHELARRDGARRGSARRASAPRAPGAQDRTPDLPLYYIHDAGKAIALTIDDGPNPVYTPQVLDVLAEYHVTATFSMIGMHVAAYPYLARAVAEAGHRIANHTWTHADLAGMPARRVHGELAHASAAIHAATGVHPALFRAPYGAWTPTVIAQCEHMGMVPVDWSVDPRDWARPGVRRIVNDILGNTRPGSIILEHDGGGNRSQTVAALRVVLPRLLREGYHFQTP
jgi:peptidoglycan/xylan/chitin deacetylase (PgdA/CDA1 family)